MAPVVDSYLSTFCPVGTLRANFPCKPRGPRKWASFSKLMETLRSRRIVDDEAKKLVGAFGTPFKRAKTKLNQLAQTYSFEIMVVCFNMLRLGRCFGSDGVGDVARHACSLDLWQAVRRPLCTPQPDPGGPRSLFQSCLLESLDPIVLLKHGFRSEKRAETRAHGQLANSSCFNSVGLMYHGANSDRPAH